MHPVLKSALQGSLLGVALVLCFLAGMVVFYGSAPMVDAALGRLYALQKASRLPVVRLQAAQSLHIFYPSSAVGEAVVVRVPVAARPYVDPKAIRVVQYP